MMIRNWTCLSSNPIPRKQPLRSSPYSIQLHRAGLHFQWEGKEEVSRLLIASFAVFSRKKTKTEATTTALLCRDWIKRGGGPAKD